MANRQVDIQTTISFLRQITGRQNLPLPLQSSHTAPKPQLKRTPHKVVPSPSQPTPNQKQLQIPSQKLSNIATSLQQALQKYYVNDQSDILIQHKSTETRLNIYFKQNSRILERIRNQNEIIRRNNVSNLEEKEARLSREFTFTVKDDCRDYISMSIQKTEQKLSKMKDEDVIFKDMLLVMVDNELKVYVDRFGGKLLRTIRMYEIENVTYNEQPFKCIVISFCKDRSKPQEHLFLKFGNSQDHDKWDRIIYINYKLWEMKHRKEKLFLTDFRKEEFKVSDTEEKIEKYEVDVKRTINELVGMTQTITPIEKKEEKEVSLKEERTVSENEAKEEMGATSVRMMSDFPPSPRNNHMTSSLRHAVSMHTPYNVDGNRDPHERAYTNENPRTPLTFQPDRNQSQMSFEPHTSHEFYHPQITVQIEPSDKERSIKSSSVYDREIEKSKSQIMEKSEVKIVETEVKPSKLLRLQDEMRNGVYVTKVNFLSKSQKVVFLGDTCFEYVNKEEYRMYIINQKNGKVTKEVSRKKIEIKDIEKIETQFKSSTGKLTVFHSGGKKFVVLGNLMHFSEWLKLKCAEN